MTPTLATFHAWDDEVKTILASWLTLGCVINPHPRYPHRSFTPDRGTMTIIIDDRERAVIPFIQKYTSDFIINPHLPLGDYILDRFVVERKSAGDFLNSMLSQDHMRSQILRLSSISDSYQPIVCLTTDLYTELMFRNIHPHSIMGQLASIFRHNISLMYFPSDDDFAYFLTSLDTPPSPPPTELPVTHLTSDSYLSMITSVHNGIGINLATELKKHFPTIPDVISATEDQIKKVPGFGPNRAKVIKEHFHAK